jgi:signal transduction histidine kinase
MAFRNLSLRRKLPLLVSGLTAGALLAAGTLAYFEVRSISVTAAEARLLSLVSELGTLTVATQAARDALEDSVARAPVVRAVLRGETVDSARLSEFLDTLRGPNDGAMPISIVKRDETVVFTTDAYAPSGDPDPAPPLRGARALGPFRIVDGRILYWVTIPLFGASGEPEGWIVQRRDIGNVRATGTALEALIGADTRLLVGTEDDSVWIDLSSGGTVDMPFDGVVTGEPYRFRDPRLGEVLAVAGPLPDGSRIVHADRTMANVMAPARAFREDALVLGTVLTALAILIGWLSSGRLTGPLEELAEAADGVASGNYLKRVQPTADDELGRLGRAFNTMADHVASADEALRQRLGEVQALATRLEAANVEAERARADAQEASRVKSEFLAVMSHEIRTPINVVVSYVELLKAGVPDQPTEKQRHYLHRIDQSSQLLVWLLNDLLDFSRIESGQMSVEMAEGSAAETVHNAISAMELFAAGKGITLTTRCEDGVQFHADPQRVHQIVLNLLSNAIKFTPSGGSVTVSCSASRVPPPRASGSDRSWVRIDVTDTGVGIPEDQITQMFEPFVRGDAERTGGTTGAGLGLAISQRLAEMMAGVITVDSPGERGTRFTLWLHESGSAVRTRPLGRPAGEGEPTAIR